MAVRPEPGSLATLSRQQVLFLLDDVSRAGVTDPHVWRAYAERAQAHASTCTVQELCAIVRALCRVSFPKRSLLNIVCRRLRSEAHKLPPRLLAQVVSDLRKLNHLEGPLLLALLARVPQLSSFETFDLPLMLCAFAQASFREESSIRELGRTLRGRQLEMTASVVSTALYSLALLDCGGDGTAAELVTSMLPRVLTAASCQELICLALAIVMLDLPAGEPLSFLLERLARRGAAMRPEAVHALGIVGRCVLLPEALRPAMRASLAADPAAAARCAAALERLAADAPAPATPCAPTSSKLQRRLARFFKRLGVAHRCEEAAGPYLLDYVLPLQIAVEVDGYKHYYAFSRSLTAKSELKLRVLRAMGWRVASLPHFEWLPRTQEDRLVYLASQIEAAAGVPLAVVRRHEAGWSPEVKGGRKSASSLPFAQPARGKFAPGVRR